MGIYTDYGRFQKAREFKDYCNSGAGIWFAFSMGSPRWDTQIHKQLNNSGDTTDILNVPPSAPAAYTPLYRWFASYKSGENIDETAPLQVQEMSLLDRSFCDSYEDSSIEEYTKGTWPTNSVLVNNKESLPPMKEGSSTEEGNFSPTILTLNKDRVLTDPEDPSSALSDKPLLEDTPTEDTSPIIPHTWNTDYTNESLVDKNFYPTPSLPAFPVSYQEDWDTIIAEAKENLVDSGDSLYLFYQDGMSEPNDSWTEPNDSTKFESWAYMYHLSQTVQGKQSTDDTDTHANKNPNARPLGLYSFIQGVAKFVEPVPEEMALNSSIATFKYGSHYWRIVPDTSITENNLPHHILLTVTVFPNELSTSSIVERELPVRQVSVFKFPDCILDQIPELKQENPTRRYQVLKRDRFVIVRNGDTIPDIPHIDTNTEQIEEWDKGRPVYLPFYIDDQVFNENSEYYDPDYDVKYKNQYLYPNPPNVVEDPEMGEEGIQIRLRGTIEMLINDFMTARKRDVQQTDRYGYIIGF